MRFALLTFASVLVLAACGGDDEAATTETTTTTTPSDIAELSVYWLRDGKVWPTLRWVDASVATAEAALGALLAGPTEQEASVDPAFTTAIPEGTEIVEVIVKDGVAKVELTAELPDEAQAQVTYTVLSQFLTIESVELQGSTLTRTDFEELTPSVLVESPLPFEEVSSPLTARGTANTFEATFSFEILDVDGELVASDFVTATSGTGTRGTFDFSQPFVVDSDEAGSLVVFELSAEDGSRINEVEIPLELRE